MVRLVVVARGPEVEARRPGLLGWIEALRVPRLSARAVAAAIAARLGTAVQERSHDDAGPHYNVVTDRWIVTVWVAHSRRRPAEGDWQHSYEVVAYRPGRSRDDIVGERGARVAEQDCRAFFAECLDPLGWPVFLLEDEPDGTAHLEDPRTGARVATWRARVVPGRER